MSTIRVTRTQLFVIADPTKGRVSREVLEVAGAGTPAVRVSREVLEVAGQGTASARVSRLALEVAHEPPGTTPLRVTREVLEVAGAATPAGRVTRLLLEVAHTFQNARVTREVMEVAGAATAAARVTRAGLEVSGSATALARVTRIILEVAHEVATSAPGTNPYLLALQMLLPRGKAWTRETDTVMGRLLTALATEFQRVGGRAADLLLEMDPRQTTELLPDWERVLGLTDVEGGPTTLAGRRAAVVSRLTARGGWSGGPSVPFLTAIIVALGYLEADLEIRRFHRPPFTCQSPCNAALNTAEAGWFYLWEIIVRSNPVVDGLLDDAVDRYTLSHLPTALSFPIVLLSDGTFTRATTATFTDPATGNQSALASGAVGSAYYGV